MGNAIKTAVTNLWNNVTSAVKNSMSNVFNAVKSGFANVKDHITGLASQAFNWGKDLIMGMTRFLIRRRMQKSTGVTLWGAVEQELRH